MNDVVFNPDQMSYTFEGMTISSHQLDAIVHKRTPLKHASDLMNTVIQEGMTTVRGRELIKQAILESKEV